MRTIETSVPLARHTLLCTHALALARALAELQVMI